MPPAYIGINEDNNSIAHKIKKMYLGRSGVATPVYPDPADMTLVNKNRIGPLHKKVVGLNPVAVANRYAIFWCGYNNPGNVSRAYENYISIYDTTNFLRTQTSSSYSNRDSCVTGSIGRYGIFMGGRREYYQYPYTKDEKFSDIFYYDETLTCHSLPKMSSEYICQYNHPGMGSDIIIDNKLVIGGVRYFDSTNSTYTPGLCIFDENLMMSYILYDNLTYLRNYAKLGNNLFAVVEDKSTGKANTNIYNNEFVQVNTFPNVNTYTGLYSNKSYVIAPYTSYVSGGGHADYTDAYDINFVKTGHSGFLLGTGTHYNCYRTYCGCLGNNAIFAGVGTMNGSATMSYYGQIKTIDENLVLKNYNWWDPPRTNPSIVNVNNHILMAGGQSVSSDNINTVYDDVNLIGLVDN